ncbi:MAG: hypothetical protein ACK4IS_10705 [Erythrobacter sp.]
MAKVFGHRQQPQTRSPAMERADILRSAGCHAIAGYFFGKPMPLGEFAAHCRQHGAAVTPPRRIVRG